MSDELHNQPGQITPSDAAFSIAVPRTPPAIDPAAADTVVARQVLPATPNERLGAPIDTSASRWDPFRLPIIHKESYAVAGEVAQGGNGRILKARDGRLDRPVALKELLAAGAVAEERFVCEALLTARLQHPSIVPVYEAGRWPSGEPFYAMKLVSGRSLADVITGARTLDARLALLPHVLAVAEAMAYAHSERIIHRDLKPANVLVGDFGETVVIDWGLAKDLAGGNDAEPRPANSTDVPADADVTAADGLTLAGAIMGTPAYMPPEQAEGAAVDERADVYALGAILYHVLAGVPPYDGTHSMDVLRQVLAGSPPALEMRQRGVPEDLRDIVRKAMARSPGDRYRSARELSDDLRRFQTGQIVAAHRYSAVELLLRFVQRYKAALSVAAAALLVLVLMGAVSVRRIIEARDHAAARQTEAETAQKEALSAQQQAIERADDLTLLQARTSLGEDPNRALAWLKTLSPSFDNWSAARMISADAQTRGISTVLRGHTKAVNYLAFSPDSSTVAATGDDGTVRLWDIRSGQSRTFTGHTDEVYGITFSHDGKTLVTGSLDTTVRLWDVATGNARVLSGHTQATMAVYFSRDDTQVFSISLDRTMRTWDVASGTTVHTASPPDKTERMVVAASGGRAVTLDEKGRLFVSKQGGGAEQQIDGMNVFVALPQPPVVFSPDGRWLAVGNRDSTVRIWDSERNKVRVLAGHTRPVEKIVFSPDGKLLASAAPDGTMRLWEPSNGSARVLEGHVRTIRLLVFSPDGKWVASASLDHTARLWDVESGSSRVLLGFADAVVCVQFSPDGKMVAAGSWDGTVRLWKLDAAKNSTWTGHRGAIYAEQFSPDGKLLATAGADSTARLWSLSGGDPVILEGHQGHIRSVAFSPDGQRVATAGDDGTARIWNLSGGVERILRGHDGPINVAAFSPDSTHLASAGGDGTVRLWDVLTGQARVWTGHQKAVHRVAFSPDGKSLASGGEDTTVRLWDLSSGESRIFRGHSDRVTALAFSPDGKALLSGAGLGDHTIHIWNLGAGGGDRVFAIGGLTTHQILFPESGDAFVVIGGDSAIRMISMKTGQVIGVLRGHEGSIQRGALSPDGRMLATASLDRTVRLWDLRTGESRALRGHTDGVTGVQFSPDGRLVVSISADKTVRLWSDDLPADPAGLRAWLNAATPQTIPIGRHAPMLP